MSTDLVTILTLVFAGMQGCASCCGFPLLIISIIFAILQTRAAARSTEVSVYNSINTQMMEIDRYFIEHPKLKPYFYECKDIQESDPDYPSVASMAECLIDFMDNVLVLSNFMPKYPWKTSWHVYFKELFSTSKVIRRFWKEHMTWYAGTMEKYYPRELRDMFIMVAKEECEDSVTARPNQEQG
jgi:hypothetical protein